MFGHDCEPEFVFLESCRPDLLDVDEWDDATVITAPGCLEGDGHELLSTLLVLLIAQVEDVLRR